jgi:hypothetical protein
MARMTDDFNEALSPSNTHQCSVCKCVVHVDEFLSEVCRDCYKKAVANDIKSAESVENDDDDSDTDDQSSLDEDSSSDDVLFAVMHAFKCHIFCPNLNLSVNSNNSAS